MTVALNIQNDQELRDYCKEMVRNTVNGITREELEGFVKTELDRKIKGLHEDNFKKMMLTALNQVISNIMYKEFRVSSWDKAWIKPYLDEYLKSLIDNAETKEKLILQIAKELTQV